MRVIAGELKGRRLYSPLNNNVRPTTDKVKEAIFSMLIPYMSEDFVAADIFAGTGGLGIEAISRGASKVYFADSSRESLSLVIQNLKYCNVEDRAIVLGGDFKNTIKRIDTPADIIFLDPPYAAKQILPALEVIEGCFAINDGGVAVCEHDIHDQLPETYGSFKTVKSKNYGKIAVTIYQYLPEEQHD